MLSNHVDLLPFYKQLAEEPVIGSILPDLYGLKILLEPNLYQNLVRTIIGQQMNLSFAAALVSRITERYGTPVQADGRLLYSFPEPGALARLEPEELMELQFSRRKAEYVIGLSRMVDEGTLDLYSLPALEDQEIFEKLLPVRGIGKWTVECFLLFGVGRTDFFPVDDIGLKNAMKLLWGYDSQPSSPEMLAISSNWSPWRSYVAYYLWAWLDEWKLQEKAAGKAKKK
nr:DNA-3-methyladenine glycosylase [Paenibacillus mangrovi]